MTGHLRSLTTTMAGFVLAAFLLPAEVAGQEDAPEDFLNRRLTPADLLHPDAANIEHGSTTLSAAESAVREALREHVATRSFTQQKEAAYDFMRLRRKVVETAGLTEGPYDLLTDQSQFPAAHVGRPVVLYGRVSAISASADGGNIAQLLDLTSDRILATLDIADVANAPARLPANGKPVRVVGFLLKIVGEEPYLCTQQLEWLTVETDPGALDTIRHRTRGIRADEASAYYETLVRARVLPLKLQQRYASAVLQARIEQRIERSKENHARLLLEAESLRETDSAAANNLVRGADARRKAEQAQFELYQEKPKEYPIFADVFRNPEIYVGQPVTMRGHVRKVMSYPADVDRFGSSTLHELWLFTEHSQQHPAVIICPKLPDGFPVDGEVADGVTVTGYFFKLYRYVADDANRAAPMLLAQGVSWQPHEPQAAGFGTAGTLATVLAILAGGAMLMYLWSNHEGDRRARESLAMARTTGPGSAFAPDTDLPSAGVATAAPTGETGQPAISQPATEQSNDVMFTAGLPAASSAPAADQANDTRGNGLDPSDLVGVKITQVCQQVSGSGSRLDLDGGRSLLLTNDVLRLQSTGELPETAADSLFTDLAGATISQVTLDQWDRVYLLVNNDTFVTEDFAEDGARCLISGELEALFAEEPDLTLRDFWTRETVR